MPRVLLAVDTSATVGSVAVAVDGAVRAEMTFAARSRYAQRLLDVIDAVLGEAGVAPAELTGAVVAVGPGSFTGLRVGIATAQGMCVGLGVPVVGVPSLDALAWNVPLAPRTICPVLDAGRGEMYAAPYRAEGDAGPVRVGDYMVLKPADLATVVTGPVALLGDGLVAYRAVLEEAFGRRGLVLPPSTWAPRAANLITIADRDWEARSAAAAPVEPLYVRMPQAVARRASRAAEQSVLTGPDRPA